MFSYYRLCLLLTLVLALILNAAMADPLPVEEFTRADIVKEAGEKAAKVGRDRIQQQVTAEVGEQASIKSLAANPLDDFAVKTSQMSKSFAQKIGVPTAGLQNMNLHSQVSKQAAMVGNDRLYAKAAGEFGEQTTIKALATSRSAPIADDVFRLSTGSKWLLGAAAVGTGGALVINHFVKKDKKKKNKEEVSEPTPNAVIPTDDAPAQPEFTGNTDKVNDDAARMIEIRDSLRAKLAAIESRGGAEAAVPTDDTLFAQDEDTKLLETRDALST